MTSYRFFLGIDVSKPTLDCCLWDGDSFDRDSMTETMQTVSNSDDGFAQLIKWLASHDATPDSTVCCMENTGFYDDRLLQALTVYGYPCAVEKNNRVRAGASLASPQG